jgi:DNA-binding beta-propeller fold protein YncE
MKSTRALLPVLALTAIMMLTAGVSLADQKPDYQVTKVLKVGGDGRWDYAIVDPQTHLLYISRSTHTQVVNTETGQVVHDLKDTSGVHGVALAPELNRGFTSNGRANDVTVFDLATGKELGTVKTGTNPDAIIYDPASKKVFAFDGRSNDASVIDAATAPNTTATRIPLDGKPEFAAADGAGHVYVNLEDKSSIAVIDSKALKVIGVWKIEGGDEPSGLAIDTAHHHLFSGCHNNLMAVIDTETGKTISTPPIGQGVDACGFDPGTGEAFASCGDGTLTVVKETSPGKFEAVETVKTRRGARTMALDPSTHTIYLAATDPAPGAAANEAPRRGGPQGPFVVLVVTQASK